MRTRPTSNPAGHRYSPPSRQTFESCCARAAEFERPWFELQRELLGFDYAQVSEAMLDHWNIPASLSQPIGLHTCRIGSLPTEQQPLAAIMSVAATTARAASWQTTTSEPVPEYDGDALLLTGIDADGIESLMSRVDAAVAESLVALLPEYR